jgi:hypothetical protein
MKRMPTTLKKASEQTNVRGVAEIFRALANEKIWRGTITQLAESLKHANAECPRAPARLAMSLRRNETVFWWNHGISMTFSRNGRRRLIQLSLRDSNVLERRRHQQQDGRIEQAQSSAADMFLPDKLSGSRKAEDADALWLSEAPSHTSI